VAAAAALSAHGNRHPRYTETTSLHGAAQRSIRPVADPEELATASIVKA